VHFILQAGKLGIGEPDLIDRLEFLAEVALERFAVANVVKRLQNPIYSKVQ